jgi:hypothetical protein
MPHRQHLTIAQLKKKYAPLGGKIVYKDKTSEDKKLATLPDGTTIPAAPTWPDAFSENERAWLLKNVAEELLRRMNPEWSFKVWARYGLSRLYFLDDSWLGYGADGRCIYGRTDDPGNSVPDKSTTAYEVRVALVLQKAAKRGTISD